MDLEQFDALSRNMFEQIEKNNILLTSDQVENFRSYGPVVVENLSTEQILWLSQRFSAQFATEELGTGVPVTDIQVASAMHAIGAEVRAGHPLFDQFAILRITAFCGWCNTSKEPDFGYSSAN